MYFKHIFKKYSEVELHASSSSILANEAASPTIDSYDGSSLNLQGLFTQPRKKEESFHAKIERDSPSP